MFSLNCLVLLVLTLLRQGVWCGTCHEAKLCCPGRDSSCVVQKALINAIVEDISDKPCYCDHACLKLGDCCMDFKQACGVVDCQVSPWGSWSSCDADCGAGTMSRSRTIALNPQNGGRHCPSLQQRRGCQVSNCHQHQEPAIKEIAILLPGVLSKTRKINDTDDIRKNLRISYPEDDPEHDLLSKHYCVEFQIVKATKACKKVPNFSVLNDGTTVCVRCEADALRKNLGYRCQGHGVVGLFTRWSALSAPHCHGKWVRNQEVAAQDQSCASKTCQMENTYIFV